MWESDSNNFLPGASNVDFQEIPAGNLDAFRSCQPEMGTGD